MDKIVIPQLPILCFVGVPDEERAFPQQVAVSLELFLDLSPAGRADDFERTADYDAVCSTVVATARARPRKLIEALAEDVAAAVLDGYDVSRVRVRVEKPNALRRRGVPYAAVEIERAREDAGRG